MSTSPLLRGDPRRYASLALPRSPRPRRLSASVGLGATGALDAAAEADLTG